MFFQNLICQLRWKYGCQGRRKLPPHVVELQPIIRRPSKRLVYDRFRPDGGPEKARRNIRPGLSAIDIGSFVCHGGRGSNADRCLVWCASVAKTTDEDRDTTALAAAIGVQFVKNDEIQSVRIHYNLGIELVLPRQQKFGHHEVSQQNVRRGVCNSLPIFLAFLAGVATHNQLKLGRQARLRDEFLDLVDLAVGQCIHRITKMALVLRGLPALRARTIASTTGTKKQSDLPEPAPVVTT